MAAVSVTTSASRAVASSNALRTVILHNDSAAIVYYEFTEAGCTTAGGIPIGQDEQAQLVLPRGAEVWVVAGSAVTLRKAELAT